MSFATARSRFPIEQLPAGVCSPKLKVTYVPSKNGGIWVVTSSALPCPRLTSYLATAVEEVEFMPIATRLRLQRSNSVDTTMLEKEIPSISTEELAWIDAAIFQGRSPKPAAALPVEVVSEEAPTANSIAAQDPAILYVGRPGSAGTTLPSSISIMPQLLQALNHTSPGPATNKTTSTPPLPAVNLPPASPKYDTIHRKAALAISKMSTGGYQYSFGRFHSPPNAPRQKHAPLPIGPTLADEKAAEVRIRWEMMFLPRRPVANAVVDREELEMYLLKVLYHNSTRHSHPKCVRETKSWNDERMAKGMNSLARKNGWVVDVPFAKEGIKVTLDSCEWIVTSESAGRGARVGVQVFPKVCRSV